MLQALHKLPPLSRRTLPDSQFLLLSEDRKEASGDQPGDKNHTLSRPARPDGSKEDC